MINRKYILLAIISAFTLLGCGGGTGSNGSTVADTQTQNEQANSNDLIQEEQATETVEDNGQDRFLKETVVETKPSNWYIRLVVEDPSRAMKTGAAQLGELEEDDAVKKHTLEALSPFGGSYLDIVFRDPLGVNTGNYKVNFHVHNEGSENTWQFTVRTDDVNADIVLSWRGLYVLTAYIDEENRQRYKEYRSMSNPLIKNMKLLDVSSGNEIAALVDGKVQIYSFNMNGKNERIFQWIVQTDEVALPVQQSKLSTLQAKGLQIDAKTNSVQTELKKAETFDLSKPPMIQEDIHGK